MLSKVCVAFCCYCCCCVGKVNNPSAVNLPNPEGFELFFGYNDQARCHNYYPYYLWLNKVCYFYLCCATVVVVDGDDDNDKVDFVVALVDMTLLLLLLLLLKSSLLLFLYH